MFTELDPEAANYCLLLLLVAGDNKGKLVKEAFLTVVAINDEFVNKCYTNYSTDVHHKTVNFPHFVIVVL